MEKITQLASLDRLQEYIKYDIREGHDGSIIIEFIPKYHNCNLYGHCHGGILMTLADNCMYATYCYTLEKNSIKCLPIPQDNIVYTKDMSYVFTRNALLEKKILFVGRIVSTLSEGKISCEIIQDNKTIGYSNAQYKLIKQSKL